MRVLPAERQTGRRRSRHEALVLVGVGIRHAPDFTASITVIPNTTKARAIVVRVTGMRDTTRTAAQSDLVEIVATFRQPVY